MGNLNEFFRDLGRNAYGLGENVASLGSAAIAEPVAGFAAMYDPAYGAQAIREGMTYTPRTQAGQMYQQGAARTLGTIAKPAMPVIDTWQRGVDIAGGYSPVAGAMLRTVPAAIGVAMGAKPALQAGRQVSNSLGAMQARMIANANAPRTLNAAGFRGQRGVFAGINALTADKEALAKAQQMIAQGVDPAQVWKETGWGKGVDGKWRFEINDKFDITDDGKTIGSSLDYNNGALPALAYGDIGVARGQQILNHNDLYEAYPDLKTMEIRAARDVMGEFDNNNQIRLNHSLLSNAVGGRDLGDTVNAHSILMHELQHKIQQTENFAKGGNPDQFKELLPNAESLQDARVMASLLRRGSTVDSVGQDFTNMIGRYPHNGATDLVRNLSPDDIHKMTADPKKAYRQLAGEVEARTTQSRLNLDPQQRRENYPFDYKTYGYDVPAKSQTVDFGNNKANAQRPLTEFEQAHLLAQQRAALPVNQRGLDLPADNTAMDRARAMGWVDDVYHGTREDIVSFDPSRFGQATGAKSAKGGVFTASETERAGMYADNAKPRGFDDALKIYRENRKKLPILEKKLTTRLINSDNSWIRGSEQFLRLQDKFKDVKSKREMIELANEINRIKKEQELFADTYKPDAITWHLESGRQSYNGENILPLMVNKEGYKTLDYNGKRDYVGVLADDIAKAKLENYNGLIVKNIPDPDLGVNTVSFNPNQLRSRFAAFDPFNRDSSNLLAQSAKFAPAATLGALMANEKRKDKRN